MLKLVSSCDIKRGQSTVTVSCLAGIMALACWARQAELGSLGTSYAMMVLEITNHRPP